MEEYQKADCFVLPSRHDSFGMAVLEALACGTPVIVSDMVGSSTIVREHHVGWIVPVGDVETLMNQMEWCVRHRHLMLEMRTVARACAMKYGWEKYHHNLVELLKIIL